MTITTLNKLMRDYNRTVAPGSECDAWGDYVDDCCLMLKNTPWDLENSRPETTISPGFGSYWCDVAAGENPDYNPDTGEGLEV